jgi:hypothetical protein
VSGLVGPASGALRRRLERGELRTTALHAAAAALTATAGFAVALGVRAPRSDLAVRCYAAALMGCAFAVVVRALAVAARGRTAPTFEDLTGAAGIEEGRPGGLASLELGVRFGTTTSGDFHVRLRPVLTDLARQRLATKGLRLDLPRHRERAEALLGADVYALVRPDVPPPEDRFAPGPGARAVERAVAKLERLG